MKTFIVNFQIDTFKNLLKKKYQINSKIIVILSQSFYHNTTGKQIFVIDVFLFIYLYFSYIYIHTYIVGKKNYYFSFFFLLLLRGNFSVSTNTSYSRYIHLYTTYNIQYIYVCIVQSQSIRKQLNIYFHLKLLI